MSGVLFLDGDGWGYSVQLPDPVERTCEDCGARHFNRYKCDDCLIAQAVADGLLAPSSSEGEGLR